MKTEIKARKGFSVGHQRQDGRYRVIAYDLDGQSLSPRMPDGRRSPCLTCPCPKEAGRREIEAKRVDLRGIRRIVVTCYPEEVATPDVAPATPRVAGSECPKCRGDQYLQPCEYCGADRPTMAFLASCFRHGDYPATEGALSECPKCLEERAKRDRERSEK